MRPDKTLRNYYDQYQADAAKDLMDYEHRLKLAKIAKIHCRVYIKEQLDYYKDECGINLNDYKLEWVANQYDSTESLSKKVTPLYIAKEAGEGKVHLLQLIKYCNTLKAIHTYELMIEECKQRKNVTYTEYRAITRNYYLKVQECLLQGFAYYFNHGIGYLSINRFVVNDKRKRRVCDFDATNKKKAEILAAGGKLYDKKEAEIAAVRGLKYDGVPYIVYKTDNVLYNFSFTGSSMTRRFKLQFEHKEYVSPELRGKGVSGRAALCKDVKDIYNLECDVRTKLTTLLEFDPTCYVKFIRTARQTHNSFTRGNDCRLRRRIY